MTASRDTLPWEETAFWDFSLTVYERKALVTACHELQDKHDADVNMLLFCCWIGASGRGALASDDFAHLSEAVSLWQREVVTPLRAARRRLKQPPHALAGQAARSLRDTVAAAELESERLEQMALVEVLERKPVITDLERRRQHVASTLAGYLDFIGSPGNEDAIATLVEETCRI
ncbi:MAG: TIGR02444 family protein [Alphaproteobacteria bacterium]|jgi:uncharacterized protein (TIGR02444 family)|nr:TIGR02444 family protein [Alphaproteobacteria bacterium]